MKPGGKADGQLLPMNRRGNTELQFTHVQSNNKYLMLRLDMGQRLQLFCHFSAQSVLNNPAQIDV